MIQILIDTILLAEIEEGRDCPMCGSSLDSGMGFGMRDYECDNCDFSLSIPASIYSAFLDAIR